MAAAPHPESAWGTARPPASESGAPSAERATAVVNPPTTSGDRDGPERAHAVPVLRRCCHSFLRSAGGGGSARAGSRLGPADRHGRDRRRIRRKRICFLATRMGRLSRAPPTSLEHPGRSVLQPFRKPAAKFGEFGRIRRVQRCDVHDSSGGFAREPCQPDGAQPATGVIAIRPAPRISLRMRTPPQIQRRIHSHHGDRHAAITSGDSGPPQIRSGAEMQTTMYSDRPADTRQAACGSADGPGNVHFRRGRPNGGDPEPPPGSIRKYTYTSNYHNRTPITELRLP